MIKAGGDASFEFVKPCVGSRPRKVLVKDFRFRAGVRVQIDLLR